MSLNGIGGQSGFNPAQAAAQYYKNYSAGSYDAGKIGQANKEAPAERPGAQGRRSPLGVGGGETQPPGYAKSSASNSISYDPRDTNGDGRISLQEDFSYTAKRYSAADKDKTGQAPKGAAEENREAQGQPSPRGGGDEGAEKSGTAEESSAKFAVYDPRDTNRDGKVSFQEEIAYAAKQYSAGGVSDNKISPTTGITGPAPQHLSISLQV